MVAVDLVIRGIHITQIPKPSARSLYVRVHMEADLRAAVLKGGGCDRALPCPLARLIKEPSLCRVLEPTISTGVTEHNRGVIACDDRAVRLPKLYN